MPERANPEIPDPEPPHPEASGPPTADREPVDPEPVGPEPVGPEPAHPEPTGRGRAGSSRRLASLTRARARLTGSDVPAPPPSDISDPGPATGGEESVEPDRERTRPGILTTLFRPGRGQVVAAVLLCLLGMAGVMQIRANSSDSAYTNARREDLIQLLDGLGVESRRLESEITDLQQTRTSLESGADTQRVARDEAERRAGMLAILAGTAPAEGPGIRMRILDPQRRIDGTVLLDAVQEMRDAGAEVIEVNDRVRVVGSTWFGGDGAGLSIDGVAVTRPITLEIIGDPHSLEEAARFRGGIVSEITGPKIGGQVQIDQESRVVVTSLHESVSNQYARPATPAPTPR